MNFQVRVIEREWRKAGKYNCLENGEDGVWITSDVSHVVVEAENKARARNLVRTQFHSPKFVLGRVTATNREEGVYEIPVKEL